jgi:hypothetical protein
MRTGNGNVEFSILIPDYLLSKISKIQAKAFLDLNDVAQDKEVALRVDKKMGGKKVFLVFSTKDIQDRKWIMALHEVVNHVCNQIEKYSE